MIVNYILIATAVVLITIVLGVSEFLRHSRDKKAATEQLAAMQRVQKDIHALCAGAINMGKHVDILEQRIRRLGERQDQLELRDPLEQTYAHAIRLAQRGVDVDELVENCGLARGEAELLLRIHHVEPRQSAVIG